MMINLIVLFCIFHPLLALGKSENLSLRRKKRYLTTVFLTEVPIVGGVTTDSAVIGFRTSEAATVHIVYANNKNGKREQHSSSYDTQEIDDYTGKIVLDGLDADQAYWYTLYVNNNIEQDFDTIQRFKTFPNPGTPFRFSIFSDAAPYYNYRNAVAYESGSSNKLKDGALFAVQIGDFDHSDPENIAAIRLMHRGLRDINDGAAGKDLAENILTKMAFVHVWDDHDYCGNDSDKTCAMKIDSLKAYDEYYPGYTRPNPGDGIYHKFNAGDAEIYMLDLRFNRDPNDLDEMDYPSKTMLGATQKNWLKDSLSASTATWKVIVTTVTANKHARPNNPDHWISFTNEAAEIKDFIEENGLSTSTVLVSGDLHTGGGLDGGCNNRFNIPELGIAHTNLKGGNLGAIGYWTEGIRDGDHKGYGSIYINATNLVLENRAANGFVVNSLTLPGSYNTDACVTLGGNAPEGLQHCSTKLASFQMPPSGDCANIEQGSNYIAPFDNADGGPAISNDVKWYDCPTSDSIIMRSNNIPEHFVSIANPNKPCVQNVHAEFPRHPIETMEKTEADNIQGFALNGVVAFSPLEAGNNNAVEPGPEATLLDAQHWFGHPTAQNVWHYHSPFLGKDDESVTLTKNDFLGVAMDGFPIFGPVSDPDNELDICNFNPLTKRYHIRLSDQVDATLSYCASDAYDDSSIEHSWKYIIGCYSGDLTHSALKDSMAVDLPSDCQEVTSNQLQTWYDYYYTSGDESYWS